MRERKLKRNVGLRKLLMLFLVCALLPVGSVQAAETKFARGTSVVAAEQNVGVSNHGLDITWLDLQGVEDLGIDGAYAFGDRCFFELRWYENGVQRMLIDGQGTVVVPSGQYSGIEAISAELFRVTWVSGVPERELGQLSAGPDYSSALIDRDGNTVDFGGELRRVGADHEGLVKVNNGTKLGYADEAGNLVIPCEYHIAEDFSEGYAATYDSETHLWAYIDKTGKPLTERVYSHAESFQEGFGLVRREGRYLYLNPQGEVAIALEGAQNARSFSDDLAVVRDANGKYGYIDQTGSFVIPAIYDEAGDFSEGVALVTFRGTDGGYLGDALIDKTGKRLTPIEEYSSLVGWQMQDGLMPVVFRKTGQRGYLNRFGSEAVPFVFDSITPFANGVALVQPSLESNLIGLLKRPAAADVISGNGLITVEINGKALDFADVDPVLEGGRVLVPMRAIFEALGAEVGWDGPTQTVTGTKDGVAVKLTVGVNEAEVNGSSLVLDMPAKLVNGRMMVPVRFIAESFQAVTDWLPETNTVKIRL